MKKIVSLLLALTMLLGMSSALATESMTGNAFPFASTDVPGISIEIVEDNELTQKVKELQPDTILAGMPEDVMNVLGDMKTINEIVTIQTFGAENFEVIPDVNTQFVFTTPYEAGKTVKLIVVLGNKDCAEVDGQNMMDFSDLEYTVIEGVANERGDVEAAFEAAWVEKVIESALMIVVSE